MSSSSLELDLGSLYVMKTFIRRMLRKNKQKLEGNWFQNKQKLEGNWFPADDDENSEYFEVDDDDDWPMVLW